MLRCFNTQWVMKNSDNPERDAEAIATWHAAIDSAATRVPRFRVEAGQVIFIDNYRAMHGRDEFRGGSRKLWRVWVWSDRMDETPDGQVTSDARPLFVNA
jgi:hypothetical protein